VVKFIQEIDRRFVWSEDEEKQWALNDALQTVWFAGAYGGNGETFHKRYKTRPDVSLAVDAISKYSNIILDWPNGLHNWLSDRRNNTPLKTGIHADFGSVLRKIQNILRSGNPIIPEIRKILMKSDILIKHWSFFYSDDEISGTISGVNAAKKLHLSQVGLHDLIKQGILKAEIRRGGSRNVVCVVRNSVEELLQKFNSGLTSQRLAKNLGITKHQVDRLYYSGLIKPLPGLGKRRVRFSANICTDIEALLTSASTPNAIMDDSIALADLPSLHQVDFVDVLQRVLSKEISCNVRSGTESLFQRVRVSMRALRDEGMSMREVASMIGVHNRMIAHLISAGCLQRGSAWTRRYRSISAADVLAFRKAYILTREVAAFMKTNTRTAIARLEEAGCVPVIAHCSASQISAVWRRRDLDAAGFGYFSQVAGS